MLKELARRYYLDEGCNCAETMIKALDESWHLGLKDEDSNLLGAFGGGCGCGYICGALAACLSALGRLTIQGNAHAPPGFRELCSEFVRAYAQAEGGRDCKDLKAMHFKAGQRCLETVEIACDVWEAFTLKHGIKPL